ncbi:MAG: hypothetical protein RL266_2564 [Bacteroidota bacterium]
MLKAVIPFLLLLPLCALAQHKGVSYELRNEVGTFGLTSLTVSHRVDNEEGITYVTDKTGKDTLYHIDQFLNGFVGLSSDGRTIVHVRSEKNSEPLEQLKITFYRDGKEFDTAELGKLLKYELDGALKQQALPKSRWLRNDSLLHKMASNSFYITDDKVFVSSDGPLLHVFDMNQMFHIYTGNGANHFMQNYYSIPNLPYRTEFTSSEYFPKGIPSTENGRSMEAVIASVAKLQVAIPEEAQYRVEVDVLVHEDGSSEVRKASVFRINTNEVDATLSESLKADLPVLKFQTSTIPPKHPAWIFSENFWMK